MLKFGGEVEDTNPQSSEKLIMIAFTIKTQMRNEHKQTNRQEIIHVLYEVM